MLDLQVCTTTLNVCAAGHQTQGFCAQSASTLPTEPHPQPESLLLFYNFFYLHSHFTYIYFAFTLYVYLHYLLLCVDVCICVHMHAMTRVWRSEDHLEELFLSFYHVGARDGTQMVRLSGKHLYLQSHVVGSGSF